MTRVHFMVEQGESVAMSSSLEVGLNKEKSQWLARLTYGGRWPTAWRTKVIEPPIGNRPLSDTEVEFWGKVKKILDHYRGSYVPPERIPHIVPLIGRAVAAFQATSSKKTDCWQPVRKPAKQKRA